MPKIVRQVGTETIDQRNGRHIVSTLTFMLQYRDKGDEFLYRIIIGDETWVSHAPCNNIPVEGAVVAFIIRCYLDGNVVASHYIYHIR